MVKAIRWNERYKFNIRPIDEDHKSLFEVVERLESHLGEELNVGKISAIIDSLILYAEEHFAREELYMRRANFPDYLSHRNEHSLFKERIYGLSLLFKKDHNKIKLDRVFAFMNNWIVKHILTHDAKYVPYINGQYSLDPDKKPIKIEENIELKVHCAQDKAEVIKLFAEIIDSKSQEAEALEDITRKYHNKIENRILIEAYNNFG